MPAGDDSVVLGIAILVNSAPTLDLHSGSGCYPAYDSIGQLMFGVLNNVRSIILE